MFLLFCLEYLLRVLCWWTLLSFLLIVLILWFIRRLSVSNCFSPGPPLKPIPPLCLSKWLQPLTSLVDKCDNWANSTWSLPVWLLALNAKISNISPVLSKTLDLNIVSRFLSWEGDRSWLKITKSIVKSFTLFFICEIFSFH